jgi:putative transposase
LKPFEFNGLNARAEFYVENNPVRVGVVKNAEDYQWSSARGHITGNFDDAIVSNNCYLLREVKDWRRYLREREDEKMIDTIRKGSLTGRPSGDEGFVKKLEKKFGRRLQALPHGRPKKTEK